MQGHLRIVLHCLQRRVEGDGAPCLAPDAKSEPQRRKKMGWILATLDIQSLEWTARFGVERWHPSQRTLVMSRGRLQTYRRGLLTYMGVNHIHPSMCGPTIRHPSLHVFPAFLTSHRARAPQLFILARWCTHTPPVPRQGPPARLQSHITFPRPTKDSTPGPYTSSAVG